MIFVIYTRYIQIQESVQVNENLIEKMILNSIRVEELRCKFGFHKDFFCKVLKKVGKSCLLWGYQLIGEGYWWQWKHSE